MTPRLHLKKSSGRAGGEGFYTTAGGGAGWYSRDSAWMRDLVVVAKNVPIWLAELSRTYAKPVTRLDQIPAEELQFIADCGVTGIWLVGLWQRSAASKSIKTRSGAAHAEDSAYAVFSYTVDEAWGGDAALLKFKAAARAVGISLGCDMVPNHTGIDSLWLREHPEWFMATPAKPFAAYSFTGENLSGEPGTSTHIEDGYFSQRDAAVVFEHTRAGQTRYIYHGNDGTGLPWNDTAQLNHTLAAVREALIATALDLARKFDFIRFDAAMTLLADHYRRLWFPEKPGEAPIAGRAGTGPAPDMPEFWSELTEIFRQRSPGTLLIAEAFWLTENYFIKTIGMHRVYNSAFMHFLAEEKNAEFSAFMTDHLQARETLNRFVNYLSTPDEKPAAEVFPNTDKYFGAMKLLATLPGLPLIAPGQIEGFREKYAMDQKTPRLAETRNRNYIERHLTEIAPLFSMRGEFSDAQNLHWLNPEPPETAKQVIAYETGATQNFRVLFNNSPAPAEFSIAGEHYSLRPYETLISAAPRKRQMAATEVSSPQEGADFSPAYRSGVVVPVSALRSHQSCGIGEFADLNLLVDWCVETGQNLIALLPVSDTGENPSPYSAVSAFALHPVYLRLADINGAEHIRAELDALHFAADSGKVYRFQEILEIKLVLLRKIYAQTGIDLVPTDFQTQDWVVDYAVYKHRREQSADTLKPMPAAERRAHFEKHRAAAGFYVWLQFHCERQLLAAADYARGRGVILKGDLPILLERDSADVWLNPDLFRTELKAGAPPDQFSAEGQNWGFPVYDWPAHRAQNFLWWKSRVARAAKFFSAYRIDHVLGFFRIWCLDAADHSGYCGFYTPSSSLSREELGAKLSPEKISQLSDASHRERALIENRGRYFAAWDFNRKLGEAPLTPDEKSQLRDLLRAKAAGDAELQRQQGFEILSALKGASAMLPCAEDLGVVPDYVAPTLSELGILSLCVLRWRNPGGIMQSPQDYPYLSVATPSVHDSSNLREWLEDEGAGMGSVEDVLRSLYGSSSAVTLIPVQDLLALDDALTGPAEKERINVPGTVSDSNWSYRLPLYLEDLVRRALLNEKLRTLTQLRRK